MIILVSFRVFGDLLPCFVNHQAFPLHFEDGTNKHIICRALSLVVPVFSPHVLRTSQELSHLSEIVREWTEKMYFSLW